MKFKCTAILESGQITFMQGYCKVPSKNETPVLWSLENTQEDYFLQEVTF